jgi:hypothetical protein
MFCFYGNCGSSPRVSRRQPALELIRSWYVCVFNVKNNILKVFKAFFWYLAPQAFTLLEVIITGLVISVDFCMPPGKYALL